MKTYITYVENEKMEFSFSELNLIFKDQIVKLIRKINRQGGILNLTCNAFKNEVQTKLN
jgi:hypothetical protein